MLATGITYRRLLPELVAEFEEREAALFCLYTWTEWEKLARDERALGVAHYRVRRLLDMNIHDASERERKRRDRELQHRQRE